MATQSELDIVYLRMAFNLSELSKAQRLKVGCLIVKDTHIISEGINGTPSGDDNCCEIETEAINQNSIYQNKCCEIISDESVPTFMSYDPKKVEDFLNNEFVNTSNLITKQDVIHAESNAIDKLARSTNSTVGSTIYLTHSPCYPCAIRIFNVKIKRLVYCHNYRDLSGVYYLKDRIDVEKIEFDKLF